MIESAELRWARYRQRATTNTTTSAIPRPAKRLSAIRRRGGASSCTADVADGRVGGSKSGRDWSPGCVIRPSQHIGTRAPRGGHQAGWTTSLRYLDDLPVTDCAELPDRSLHATEAVPVRARTAFRQTKHPDLPSEGTTSVTEPTHDPLRVRTGADSALDPDPDRRSQPGSATPVITLLTLPDLEELL